MDVVEFLRQRLDEEEVQAQLAQHCAPSPWKYVGGQKFANTAQILDGASASLGECEDCGVTAEYDDSPAIHIACWHPARILAEIAAKRAILDGFDPIEHPTGPLYALVQPYADHEDFDPAWRA